MKLNKEKMEDFDYFIKWVENFFKLKDSEKREMINRVQNEQEKKYLTRISKLKTKEEQEEEIHYLKYGQ